MTIEWRRFAGIVHGNQRFVLTSHIRPDCDALGSELGMSGVLRALGKEVAIINAQPTPPNLEFIDPNRLIRTVTDPEIADILRGHDVFMVLDTSAWAQLGAMGEILRGTTARKLVVDHHVGEDDLAAELFKDQEAEATGRLVVEAADALGVPIDAAVAEPLFAAVATDTGWFRFPSANARTYELAARLITAGAVPSKIYNQLYEQDTAGRVRLRGLILSRLQVELSGRLAHTYVLPPDYAAMQALPTDTEDVVNLTLGVAGTEFAVIFVALLKGGYKVSFRSRCAVDCNQLAARFGGGGHRAAAGATLGGTLEEVQAKVLTAVREALVAPGV